MPQSQARELFLKIIQKREGRKIRSGEMAVTTVGEIGHYEMRENVARERRPGAA